MCLMTHPPSPKTSSTPLNATSQHIALQFTQAPRKTRTTKTITTTTTTIFDQANTKNSITSSPTRKKKTPNVTYLTSCLNARCW
jgi:hypothetical protein